MDVRALRELLETLVADESMLFVTGPPEAIAECTVHPGTIELSVDGRWVTIEDAAWHIHVDARQLAGVKFRRVPDVHDRRREAFYVSFKTADGETLFRAFFTEPYDDAGRLRTERVAAFEGARDRFHAAAGAETSDA